MKKNNGIKSYWLENEIKIIILKNKINIQNYNDIEHINSDEIFIKSDEFNIIVKGKNLIISKLLSNEVLITGNYSMIEFR